MTGSHMYVLFILGASYRWICRNRAPIDPNDLYVSEVLNGCSLLIPDLNVSITSFYLYPFYLSSAALLSFVSISLSFLLFTYLCFDQSFFLFPSMPFFLYHFHSFCRFVDRTFHAHKMFANFARPPAIAKIFIS